MLTGKRYLIPTCGRLDEVDFRRGADRWGLIATARPWELRDSFVHILQTAVPPEVTVKPQAESKLVVSSSRQALERPVRALVDQLARCVTIDDEAS